MGMKLLQDGLLAFFAAAGLAACVWCLAEALLPAGRGVPGVTLSLRARGEAPALEADVRELVRLGRGLPGARIVLVDCGLTPESRRAAELLVRRWAEVRVCAENEWKQE
jgi:hypothetical protein